MVRRLLQRLCILGTGALAGVAVMGGLSMAAVTDSHGSRPLLQSLSPTVRGIEGCAEPQFIEDQLGVVGKPFALRESVECLPGGDTFSTPVIHWGDGMSSDGRITGTHSVTGEPGYVTVEGEHVYGQPGGFSVSISVADDQTGVLYEGGWHTNALISEPAVVPTPQPSPPSNPQPPVEPKSLTTRLAAHARSVSTVRGRRRREVVATLATNATPATLRARISWGDGAVSDGTISGTPPSLHVTGRHGWRYTGQYVMTITVTGPEGHILAVTVGHANVHTR